MTVAGAYPSGAMHVSPTFISLSASASDAVLSFFISIFWCFNYFLVTLSAKVRRLVYITKPIEDKS